MPTKKSLVHSHDKNIVHLEELAIELRELVIEMLLLAKSGHSAGSLGTAEIFATLYFHVLNTDPKDEARDRFILSNGHICPVWYATLYKKGYIKKTDLWNLRKIDSLLQGHPHINKEIGIENSSGPIGQGLSHAIGVALAAKMDGAGYRVVCMTGDGELNEGQVWEAAMFAPHYDLNNLLWIIDRNNIQIDGYTEHVMPLEKLRDKLEAFNWYVMEVDGHNVEELINACNMAKAVAQRPTVVIAHTIPGYGVDFMEYKFEWHGKPPNKVEAQKALKQLRTLEGKIKNEYD